MDTKKYFEEQIRKHGKFTVYSSENIELTITTEPYLTILGDDHGHFHFDMDCKDIEDYCRYLGLYLNPTNNNSQEETR